MSRKHFVVIALAGLACSIALILRKGKQRILRGEWPVNLAHRGASTLAPENTIEAFRIAVEEGAGGLELDVHLTREGQVVVIHDPTVDRSTSGTGAVSEMTSMSFAGSMPATTLASVAGPPVRTVAGAF